MRGNLAGLYDELGNYEEAEQLLLVNYESLIEIKGDGDPRTIEHLSNLVDFYNKSEQPQKREKYSAILADHTNE